jgi:hypothetical protein
MIAALLITLCNVGAGVVYACKCYEAGGAWCEGNFCWADAFGRCHCSDEEIEIEA